MAIYLAGFYDKKSLENSREYGLFFESLVYHHLRILVNLFKPKANIYHYRTIGGQEVDFIIEYGNKLVAVEVKMADKVKYDDLKNIRIFTEEYPETIAGLIIYTGSELKYMDKKIMAVPISNIL